MVQVKKRSPIAKLKNGAQGTYITDLGAQERRLLKLGGERTPRYLSELSPLQATNYKKQVVRSFFGGNHWLANFFINCWREGRPIDSKELAQVLNNHYLRINSNKSGMRQSGKKKVSRPLTEERIKWARVRALKTARENAKKADETCKELMAQRVEANFTPAAGNTYHMTANILTLVKGELDMAVMVLERAA